MNPFPVLSEEAVYFKLFEAAGITPQELVSQLLVLGLEKKRLQDRLKEYRLPATLSNVLIKAKQSS